MRPIKASPARISVNELVSQMDAKPRSIKPLPPRTPASTAAAQAAVRQQDAIVAGDKHPRLTSATAPRLEGFRFDPVAKKYARESTKTVTGPSGNSLKVTQSKLYTLDQALARMDRVATDKKSR
jgi:hypothetical protein